MKYKPSDMAIGNTVTIPEWRGTPSGSGLIVLKNFRVQIVAKNGDNTFIGEIDPESVSRKDLGVLNGRVAVRYRDLGVDPAKVSHRDGDSQTAAQRSRQYLTGDPKKRAKSVKAAKQERADRANAWRHNRAELAKAAEKQYRAGRTRKAAAAALGVTVDTLWRVDKAYDIHPLRTFDRRLVRPDGIQYFESLHAYVKSGLVSQRQASRGVAPEGAQLEVGIWVECPDGVIRSGE